MKNNKLKATKVMLETQPVAQLTLTIAILVVRFYSKPQNHKIQ